MIRRGKRVIEERPLSATGYKFIDIRSVPLRRAWLKKYLVHKNEMGVE